MMQAAPAFRATPLNAVHRRMGAKMVDFGGWHMPVQYSGVLEEHHAVRHAVGLFDVSHMGEIEVRGPEALRLVNMVATNDAATVNQNSGETFIGVLGNDSDVDGNPLTVTSLALTLLASSVSVTVPSPVVRLSCASSSRPP